MTNHGNQLVMKRKDLEGLPEVVVPEGFVLREYRDGDDAAWGELVKEYCATPFEQIIKSHRFYGGPEAVKFICVDDKPVATATAWGEEGDDTLGVVHMVGAAPEFRGKALGFVVSNAVLHQLKRDGKTAAALLTDDFRLPAIKTYLKLGFEPVIANEEHTNRWEQVYQNLKCSQ